MARKHFLLTLLYLGLASLCNGQLKYSSSSAFSTYKGLIMAGYQGWFNAPGDGAQMGWNHYATDGHFEPGFCKIDFWPEVREYQRTYPTPFKMPDGSAAYLFSSYDSQTVDIHFQWMKEYGLDGVFLQRNVSAIKDPANLRHANHVLWNALVSSARFGRAIAVMYDFSGLKSDDMDLQVIINDWKYLVDSMKIARKAPIRPIYTTMESPLWGYGGVGFPERPNDLKTTEKLIAFLKNDSVYGGCSVLLGVPAYWRDLARDTEKDPYLHELLKKIDILRPWFVGRFNQETYKTFKTRIASDIAWCKQRKIDYSPVVFPGFSWHNMHPDKAAGQIPRNSGQFYWDQLTGAIQQGAEMIYVAMFDEMDEGTAIFKLSSTPPAGASKFEQFEAGIPPDYYLYLTGMAAKMLRKTNPAPTSGPIARPPLIEERRKCPCSVAATLHREQAFLPAWKENNTLLLI